MTPADLIKPLVWVEHCRRSGNTSAKAVGGEYACERAGDDGHYGVWTPYSGPTDDPLAYFPSLKSAQAAAQADYTARILSALDPDAIAKIRADALREAVEAIAYKAKEADLTAALADDAGHYLAADMDREVAAGIRIGAAAILTLIQKEKDDAE